MRIFVQELIDDIEYYNSLDIVNKGIYDIKFNFVFERLYLLDPDMTNEEGDESDVSTHILLKMGEPDYKDFIFIKGYSEQLKNKIKSCFSTEDFVYLGQQIHQFSQGFHN